MVVLYIILQSHCWQHRHDFRTNTTKNGDIVNMNMGLATIVSLSFRLFGVYFYLYIHYI